MSLSAQAANASGSGERASSPAAVRAERLRALDAFRGITIAGMILVNSPGSWRVYGPLRHADWNGWTPTDLIFPFFLFIVGVAITFALGRRVQRGDARRAIVAKILRRMVIIFALGLFLNTFPYFTWTHLRIPGVLQRIALCYGAAALLVLTTGAAAQAAVASVLVLGYWAVMALVPVPGHGEGGFGPGSNLAAYLDNALLAGHLWHRQWDPEGILSTFPAIATTLAGVLTGHWLRSDRDPVERVAGLFAAGNVAVVTGMIMGLWFPINKNLWSSSFVVFTAGMAMNFLAGCYWLIDVYGFQRWATPFIIYGTNPILAYLLSSLAYRVLLLWRVPGPGGAAVPLRKYLMQHLFLPIASPLNASLLFALVWVFVWLGATALLYRKRIFLKV